MNIIVLAGGKSSEREVSLKSGYNIFQALKKLKYNVELMDSNNKFFDTLKIKKIDLVFIALHGNPGEDGSIQGLLDTLNINYTGSGILGSSICLNKIISKRILQSANIPTPDFYHIPEYSKESLISISKKIISNLKLPVICKPTSEGSSVGISIIKQKEKLFPTLKKIKRKFKDVFVEKFIDGKILTIGVIEKSGIPIALPILELKPKREFYDYKAKYTKGLTDFIIPAKLPPKIYKKTQEYAIKIFQLLYCKDFARIDIILEKNSFVPYVHDINTIPGMTDLSDLPAEAKAAGISYTKLIDIIVKNAIKRKNYGKKII